MEVNFDLCLEDLIAAVEENPPIYHSDFGSGSLKNIKARKKAWESVLSTLLPDYENQPKKAKPDLSKYFSFYTYNVYAVF